MDQTTINNISIYIEEENKLSKYIPYFEMTKIGMDISDKLKCDYLFYIDKSDKLETNICSLCNRYSDNIYKKVNLYVYKKENKYSRLYFNNCSIWNIYSNNFLYKFTEKKLRFRFLKLEITENLYKNLHEKYNFHNIYRDKCMCVNCFNTLKNQIIDFTKYIPLKYIHINNFVLKYANSKYNDAKLIKYINKLHYGIRDIILNYRFGVCDIISRDYNIPFQIKWKEEERKTDKKINK